MTHWSLWFERQNITLFFFPFNTFPPPSHIPSVYPRPPCFPWVLPSFYQFPIHIIFRFYDDTKTKLPSPFPSTFTFLPQLLHSFSPLRPFVSFFPLFSTPQHCYSFPHTLTDFFFFFFFFLPNPWCPALLFTTPARPHPSGNPPLSNVLCPRTISPLPLPGLDSFPQHTPLCYGPLSFTDPQVGGFEPNLVRFARSPPYRLANSTTPPFAQTHTAASKQQSPI